MLSCSVLSAEFGRPEGRGAPPARGAVRAPMPPAAVSMVEPLAGKESFQPEGNGSGWDSLLVNESEEEVEVIKVPTFCPFPQ